MMPQRNLSLLANRLAREGRRPSEELLERDYCISWILTGLYHSPLKDLIVFKGGTALKKCYYKNYRFSEDMDFTFTRPADLEEIQAGFRACSKWIHEASGIIITLNPEDITRHKNGYTFFLVYEGPLPKTGRKSIKTDITISEQKTHQYRFRKLQKEYTEYEDLPNDAKVYCYDLKEITCEKLVALLDPDRNEPRDLYDLYFIVIFKKDVLIADILQAFKEKWSFRKKPFVNFSVLLDQKGVRLKRLWDVRLANQFITHLPEFETVFRKLRAEIRRSGLLHLTK